MTTPDLTPSRLRALADEWRMLDLQFSMSEAEMARYEKLPLLMATALENVADWRAGLESEIAGDVECTREQLCMAVDAGADQADIDRLNRAVWTLFDRASALRLVFRRIDLLAARVIELEAERHDVRNSALEEAARLLETMIVTGPEHDDVNHDDYRDSQFAALIRGLKRTALETPNAD